MKVGDRVYWDHFTRPRCHEHCRPAMRDFHWRRVVGSALVIGFEHSGSLDCVRLQDSLGNEFLEKGELLCLSEADLMQRNASARHK